MYHAHKVIKLLFEPVLVEKYRFICFGSFLQKKRVRGFI